MIRKATTDDLDQISADEKENFSDSWSRSLLLHEIFCGTMYVIENEKKEYVGYFDYFVSGNDCELSNICINRKYRKMGYAKEAINYLFSKKYDNYYLEVRHSNENAIRLYESMGFEKIATRKNYYRNPKEDAEVYRYVCDGN